MHGDEADMDWRTAVGSLWVAAALALYLRAMVQALAAEARI